MNYPVAAFLFFSLLCHAQDTKISAAFFDGTVVAGYVDKGGFVNFTGPNVNMVSGSSRIALGMMPSLRFKDDTGATRNAFVTPSLGAGITWSYKHLAFQVPFYYNAKTATRDGKWNVGIGLGYRFK